MHVLTDDDSYVIVYNINDEVTWTIYLDIYKHTSVHELKI